MVSMTAVVVASHRTSREEGGGGRLMSEIDTMPIYTCDRRLDMKNRLA